MIEQLWDLLEHWYQIANNEAVDTTTRFATRECANQLDDLLGIYGSGGRP